MLHFQSSLPQSVAAKAETLVNAHIGARIRAQRVHMGFGLDLFAHAIGVPVRQVDKFECGAVRVSSDQLVKISDILGTPIEFFLQ